MTLPVTWLLVPDVIILSILETAVSNIFAKHIGNTTIFIVLIKLNVYKQQQVMCQSAFQINKKKRHTQVLFFT